MKESESARVGDRLFAADRSAYDVEADVQQIRIVIEVLSSHVPTALDLDDALSSATSSTVGSA